MTCAQLGYKCGLTSAQIGQKSNSELPPNSGGGVPAFYSQLGNNFAHILWALQISKQCKPVQVHLFTKIPPEEKFSQIACWGSIPNPLWTPPAVSAAHSFWILLLTDFCAICIEVQFSINEKMKIWEKLYLIIYVMCGNSLPDKLLGSLVGTPPTSNESGNARYNFIPSWLKNFVPTWHKVKNVGNRKSENHFDIIYVEVEGLSFMLADELDKRQCFYFLKINFVPSWDEVLRCNLHQSNT